MFPRTARQTVYWTVRILIVRPSERVLYGTVRGTRGRITGAVRYEYDRVVAMVPYCTTNGVLYEPLYNDESPTNTQTNTQTDTQTFTTSMTKRSL